MEERESSELINNIFYDRYLVCLVHTKKRRESEHVAVPPAAKFRFHSDSAQFVSQRLATSFASLIGITIMIMTAVFLNCVLHN